MSSKTEHKLIRMWWIIFLPYVGVVFVHVCYMFIKSCMRLCVNLDHVDELVHNGDVRITVAEHIINLGKVNRVVRDGHQPETVEKQLYEMGKSKNDDCAICLDEFIEKHHIEVVVSCQHSFYEDCIKKWLSYEHSCPLC
ncbi:E3 ubiquitin protein ligase RLIM-like protein [Tanacetum coccineum]|uniref:E3 ubiquitin protein ligase RLIM-like protein n=1 Tax=Tanacetum coccineum TaxID=301880 RepID=A0ABQ5DXZ0_9ASTR